VQSDAEPALWILHGENGTVLSMFYVDDGLVVAARTDVEADALVELVASIFEIRALGEPKDFLASRSAGIMQPTPSPLPRKARPQLSQRSWVCLDAAQYCPCQQRCMQD
jgi:hypothetical protein